MARRYAEAFVNSAQRAGSLSTHLEDIKAVAQGYAASKQLQKFLGSPEIAPEEKRRLLNKVWSESVGQPVMSLLLLLQSWDRIDHLPEIAEEAQATAEKRQGIVRGKVITAHPISSAETDAVAQRVGRLLKKQVILERAVEPSLLGGARVIVGSTTLDGSVQAALETLRQRLKAVKV